MYGDKHRLLRQIIWVAGEAGIGKTTVTERFLRDVGSDAIGYGRYIEQHGASEPYLPVLEALAALCLQDASLSALLARVAPTWLLQMPWLADEHTPTSLRERLADVRQERMLREFGDY